MASFLRFYGDVFVVRVCGDVFAFLWRCFCGDIFVGVFVGAVFVVEVLFVLMFLLWCGHVFVMVF